MTRKEIEEGLQNYREFQEIIWKDRYAAEGEKTKYDTYKRVAKAIAANEKPEKRLEFQHKFQEILEQELFIPGGRILSGAGFDNKATLLNCFVEPIGDDSLDAILRANTRMAFTMKYGGGVGVDFSILRPKNCPTSTKGQSCGPVSFMDIFDTTTAVISQGGSRRGALICSLDVNHPDIEEFVEVKRNHNKLNNANVSVKVTDEFMEAVCKKKKFELFFRAQKVSKRIDALDLYTKLVYSNYTSAEPGIIYWDTVKRFSNTELFAPLIGTNPCFFSKMRILTSKGWLPIGTLIDKDIELYDGENFIKGKVWKTGQRKGICLHVSDGRRLELTPEHKIHTLENGWVEANKTLGMKIPKHTLNSITENFKQPSSIFGETSFDLLKALGFLQGDGSIYDRGGVTVCFTPKKDTEFIDSIIVPMFSQIARNIDELDYQPKLERNYMFRFGRLKFSNWLNEIGFSNEHLPTRTLPKFIWELNSAQKAAFLQGLYGANGNVLFTKPKGAIVRRIVLVSSCREMLNEVQLLLYELGIIGNIWVHNKEVAIKWYNGTYTSKESYHLVISHSQDIIRFSELISFPQEQQKNKLRQILDSYNNKQKDSSRHNYGIVTKIENLNIVDDVYDFNVPTTHQGFVNGICCKNCGEQPLEGYGSCDLGALNLPNFVSNSILDKEKLVSTITLAVRFLDNVLDVTHYPFEEQKTAAHLGRRIGLGIMGLADYFFKLELTYGSDESLTDIENTFKLIQETAYNTSIDLAKEKGEYPASKIVSGVWQRDENEISQYVKNIENKELRERIINGENRNCTTLTAAPTGTGSILVGVSSGIEPLFSQRFFRKDRTGRRLLYHPAIAEYMLSGNEMVFKNLPSYFITAPEIEPSRRIAMQAVLQRYIDSAISSTINLPSNVTLEAIADLYIEAWKQGLKGLTIFRETSRDGVLSSV